MELVALVVPIFLVLLLGYSLRKSSFIDASFTSQLNRLAYWVLLPVLLFIKTARVEPGELLHAPALIGFPLAILVTATIASLIAIAIDRRQRGAFVQVSFRANLAYLGLPIVISAYGDEAAATVAVIVAVGTIVNTVLSIATLRMYHAQEGGLLRKLAGIGKNPLIIGIGLGLLAAALDLRMPHVVWATLDLLAQMSLPAILLVAGFSLSFRNIGAHIAVASIASMVKLIVMPAVAWLVVTALFPTDELSRSVVVLMAAMPSAIVSQTFARQFEADETITAGIVSMDTLLSMATVPLTIVALQTMSNF